MKLGQYIIYRILGLMLQFIGVLFILFYTFNVIPYDPKGVFLWSLRPVGAEAQQKLLDSLEEQWGVNKPLYVRVLEFLSALFTQGSLGQSWYGGEVMPVIRKAFPFSMMLLLVSMLLIIPASLYLGSLAARRSQSGLDLNLKLVTSVIYGVPYYIFVVLFLLYLDVKDIKLNDSNSELIRSTIAVSIVVLVFISYQYRLVRKEFLGVLKENYVLTARAKGLRERRVIFVHALRNILPRLITGFTNVVPIVFSAIVVEESMLNLPGLGNPFVGAAIGLDWGMMIGFSAFFFLVNGLMYLVSDVIVIAINPLEVTYN